MLENLVHKKFVAQMPYFKDLFKQWYTFLELQ